jgi:hypothetical protein
MPLTLLSARYFARPERTRTTPSDRFSTTFEVAKRDDHPWMKILDLGSGAALNVFEVPADEIIGERRS